MSSKDESYEDVTQNSQSDDFGFDDKESFTSMFKGLTIYVACNSSSLISASRSVDHAVEEDIIVDPDYEIVMNFIEFLGGLISYDWQKDDVTHIVCPKIKVSTSTKSMIAR